MNELSDWSYLLFVGLMACLILTIVIVFIYQINHPQLVYNMNIYVSNGSYTFDIGNSTLDRMINLSKV